MIDNKYYVVTKTFVLFSSCTAGFLSNLSPGWACNCSMGDKQFSRGLACSQIKTKCTSSRQKRVRQVGKNADSHLFVLLSPIVVLS